MFTTCFTEVDGGGVPGAGACGAGGALGAVIGARLTVEAGRAAHQRRAVRALVACRTSATGGVAVVAVLARYTVDQRQPARTGT